MSASKLGQSVGLFKPLQQELVHAYLHASQTCMHRQMEFPKSTTDWGNTVTLSTAQLLTL